MTVLFIDDEYEQMRNFCMSLEEYFGSGQVYKVKSAEKAIELLEDNPFLIDLAIIDHKLQGTQNGLELGRNINNKFPYIPLIMLTGYPDLQRCTEAMQIGFSDFLDKSTDIINEALLEKSLNRITSLSSVKAKIELKQQLQDTRLRIKNLCAQINKARIDIPYKSKRPRREKKIPTMEEMLLFQEKVFEVARDGDIEIDGDTLAIGMLILENKLDLDVPSLQFVKESRIDLSVSKFNIKFKKPRATVQMRLQFFQDDIISDAGILAVQLLKANPNAYKLSIAKAKNKGRGMETFIDELVSMFL